MPVRRRRLAIWSAVIVALALAFVATALASAAARPQSPQKAAMNELLQWYSAKSGRIGPTWWQAAVALSTIETYAQTTGDRDYDPLIKQAFDLNAAHDFENSSDDDTAWWALAWLQAYQITHVRAYLSMAETDANYIHQDWDSTCGGGIWWQRDPRAYKNAISNELFLELTAWLHNTIRGDTKYLQWAESEWAWFSQSGMINSTGLVNDGLDNNCHNNGQNTWTYNQGVILAGLAQLYRATGNRGLLTEAEHLATASISHLTVHGVLTEPCQGAGCEYRLGIDGASFKGIFVRDLKVLAVTAKTTQFNTFFRQQARSIEAHDTGRSHRMGLLWSGPVAQVTAATQDSALDALVASLKLPSRRRS
jgi:predicted alpha-1,6-mannanase (GH76 family)